MSVSLRRIGLIAARDYKTTITSRGFLIGLLVMPVLVVVLFVLIPPHPHLAHAPGDRRGDGHRQQRQSNGRIAACAGGPPRFWPAAPSRRRKIKRQKTAGVAQPVPAGPPIPVLSVVPLSADSDVQARKSWLIQPRGATPQHLAIVVVQPDAVVRRTSSTAFGGFDLYTSSHLDEGTETTLRNSVRVALAAAPTAHHRPRPHRNCREPAGLSTGCNRRGGRRRARRLSGPCALPAICLRHSHFHRRDDRRSDPDDIDGGGRSPTVSLKSCWRPCRRLS